MTNQRLYTNKAMAIGAVIDALQCNCADLTDIWMMTEGRLRDKGVFDQDEPCNTDKPHTPCDVIAVREYVAALKAESANQGYIELPDIWDDTFCVDDTFTGISGQRDDDQNNTVSCINRANEYIDYLG